MLASSLHPVRMLGALSVLTMLLGCAPASPGEDGPLGAVREADCGHPPDKIEDVSTYDGTLGVSVDFVNEHARPVGGGSNATCMSVSCRIRCTGTLIARDLVLTAQNCGQVGPSAGWRSVDEIGFGWPETRYQVDSVVERDADLGYAILRVAGSPGDSWGIARLSALAGPPDQLVASIFRSDKAAPRVAAAPTVDLGLPSWFTDLTAIYSGSEEIPSGNELIQVSSGAVIGVGYGELQEDCDIFPIYTVGIALPIAVIATASPTIRNIALDAAKVSVLF